MSVHLRGRLICAGRTYCHLSTHPTGKLGTLVSLTPLAQDFQIEQTTRIVDALSVLAKLIRHLDTEVQGLDKRTQELENKVNTLDEEALRSGYHTFEGAGQIDGVPAEFTLGGELQ